MVEDLTVVIPVYGQWKWLDRCVRSIDRDIPIVLVEDHAEDFNTEVYLRGLIDSDRISLYRNRKNLGFAKTVNKGVYHANTKYVCICNSDIEFADPQWAEKSLELLTKDVGVVGMRLLHDNGTIQHGGVVMDWEDRGGNTVHRWKDKQGSFPRYCRVEQVDFVTGALMIMRRDLFLEVKGMPIVYGRGYYEDMELCVTLRVEGYKVLYNGKNWAYHFGHKSFNAIGHDYANSEKNFRIWQKRNLKRIVKLT